MLKKLGIILCVALVSSSCSEGTRNTKLFCGHIAAAEGIAIAIGGWVDESNADHPQQCNKLVAKAKRKIPAKDATLFGPKKGIECSDTEDEFGYNICTKTCMKAKPNRIYKVRQYNSDQKGNQKYCRTS